MTENIKGYYRAPFSGTAPRRLEFAPGLTIGAMAALADLPSDFYKYGTITVGGVEMLREHWSNIRPKSGYEVTFHYNSLRGGQAGAGRKAVLGVALAIATVLTAGAATVGIFETAGGLFAAGSTSASVLAGGVSNSGSLAEGFLE